jgi:hypothetical protein
MVVEFQQVKFRLLAVICSTNIMIARTLHAFPMVEVKDIKTLPIKVTDAKLSPDFLE